MTSKEDNTAREALLVAGISSSLPNDSEHEQFINIDPVDELPCTYEPNE